jgi:hypothetical protein
MDWTLEQIFSFNSKQLSKLLVKLYSDKTKYTNLVEKRNAFIIQVFNEDDLIEDDIEYVASDNYKENINKAKTAQELKNLIKNIKTDENNNNNNKNEPIKNKGYKLKINGKSEIVKAPTYGDKKITIPINTVVNYEGFDFRMRALIVEFLYDDNRWDHKPYLIQELQYYWYSDEDKEYHNFNDHKEKLKDTVGRKVNFDKNYKIIDVTP